MYGNTRMKSEMTERAKIIQERKKWLEIRNGYLVLLIRILLLLATASVLFGLVFLLFRAEGMDMSPAVKDGDVLFAYRLQREYGKNDLVIYRTEGRRRVGRIAAASGDVLDSTEDGTLLVNGVVQIGEQGSVAAGDADYPSVVPDNCVYIVADNRRLNRDSRDFGAIPCDLIEGKVIALMRRRGF